MDADTRKEAKLRTLRLGAYDVEKALLDRAEAAMIRMYAQTHETINGRRIQMTKRRKIAKFNAAIDRLFSDEIDVRQDAINQARSIDGA